MNHLEPRRREALLVEARRFLGELDESCLYCSHLARFVETTSRISAEELESKWSEIYKAFEREHCSRCALEALRNAVEEFESKLRPLSPRLAP